MNRLLVVVPVVDVSAKGVTAVRALQDRPESVGSAVVQCLGMNRLAAWADACLQIVEEVFDLRLGNGRFRSYARARKVQESHGGCEEQAA